MMNKSTHFVPNRCKKPTPSLLSDEVHQHVPLASITDWVVEEEGDQSALDFLAPFGTLYHFVEEIVATFNLVDEN